MPYAQTNIQLYNQMAALGYEDEDLGRVRNGYEQALELFAGQIRANGKPQLAHLVGTASILAAQRAPGYVVAAGLLHATFSHGEFGDLTRGRTETKARRLSETVGPDAEALVSQYDSERWTTQRLHRLGERSAELSEHERYLVLVKLADILEEFDDCGIKYCGHKKLREVPYDADAARDLTVETARKIGRDDLAAEFERALERMRHFEPPAPVASSRERGSLVPPLTHRTSVRARIKRRLRRWARKLGR